jgi:chromatin assembly factor 1 subunit B
VRDHLARLVPPDIDNNEREIVKEQKNRKRMKVETPQILWNSEGDKGQNAPLYSIAMQESGIANDSSPQKYGHVLVTAGNTTIINLWRVSFGGSSGPSMFQKQLKPLNNQIEYMMSLTRHELPVNTVAFSPDGLHLVTAGEAGNIVLWSVPVSKRGNGNGRHFWSTISKESDLSVRIVSTHAEGVCDISWSADSKRFVVGATDSSVLIYEDKHFSTNQCSPETHQKESEWQLVFRNQEHNSFVQGVSYDPLGVYVASMGSDRTVRVFHRKTPPKSKKKVLRPSNAPRTVSPPQGHQRMVSRLLTESKMEVGKTKRIKQRTIRVEEDGSQVKQRLYVDESTCESFFRRLSWTADGAFLVTPAALWHQDDSNVSFSTYLFARHRFDEPCMVLSGLEKVGFSFGFTFISLCIGIRRAFSHLNLLLLHSHQLWFVQAPSSFNCQNRTQKTAKKTSLPGEVFRTDPSLPY